MLRVHGLGRIWFHYPVSTQFHAVPVTANMKWVLRPMWHINYLQRVNIWPGFRCLSTRICFEDECFVFYDLRWSSVLAIIT